jgi:hypothetical protein
MKTVLTPQKAQELQEDIFRKMSVSQKIRLSGDLLRLCKKLSKLNDRKKWK